MLKTKTWKRANKYLCSWGEGTFSTRGRLLEVTKCSQSSPCSHLALRNNFLASCYKHMVSPLLIFQNKFKISCTRGIYDKTSWNHAAHFPSFQTWMTGIQKLNKHSPRKIACQSCQSFSSLVVTISPWRVTSPRIFCHFLTQRHFEHPRSAFRPPPLPEYLTMGQETRTILF